MQTITFQCETITPMFLAGADGTTPELRAPSIKGALRFWWRAMNGHLSLEAMRKAEGEVFGDTTQRSSLILYPLEIIKTDEVRISGTPHHRNGYCQSSRSNCFYGNGNSCKKANTQKALFYTFIMRVRFNDAKISKENIEKLFKTTFLLGGIGKRERRGFGSIQITSVDTFSSKQEIEKFISSLSTVTSTISYPFFKKVEIGKKCKDYSEVLIAIGEASHNYANDALGFAKGQQRFASPIYASVIKDENGSFYPILTTLNTSAKNPINNLSAQTNFIKALKPATI